ncbi:hypothetical protein EGW08_020585 [Elysia chlorotica]|uniref:Uncharacterized protein n=1 Tax=Elysia chlorotica TaxID=188477 RepID=A0A433SQY3_ELYCH|nr:hypothetical protein EGW08_020585 [Elysia chlorotica]
MLPPAAGPTLALQLPTSTSTHQGYHVNVLGSSLVARLKKRQPKEAAIPPTHAKSKPALKKTKATMGLKWEGLQEDDMNTSDDGQNDSYSASKRPGKVSDQRSQTGSAASRDSQTLPRLTSAPRSPACSRLSSRRSFSAGRAQERGESRRSGTCPSAASLGPRAPNFPVHVVKRDGVFQPADKYMPARTAIRESGPATLCDYHTYVLPVMDSNSDTQSPRFSDSDLSPRGIYIGSGKKRMKVSWKAALQPEQSCQNGMEPTEPRQDTNPTPSTPAPASASKQRRAQSVDNLAFRRPTYTSGHSQVCSIGLKWEIQTGGTYHLSNAEPSSDASSHTIKVRDGLPSASTPHSTTAMLTSASKPMWSYLVTHDTKLHQLPPQPSVSTSSKAKLKESKSSKRGQRPYKDVHPVSTAMERYGTSVSKTRWTVPSSSNSGLEAQRVVRERLQLIKRTGSLVLYEPGGRGTSNSAARLFRQAMAAAGRQCETDNNNGEEQGSATYCTSKERDREREAGGSHLSAAGSRRRGEDKLTQVTTSGTNDKAASTHEEDQSVSSPTKSRSTMYNN